MLNASACIESFPRIITELFLAVTIGSLAYGILTVIFPMSMYILLCRGLDSKRKVALFTGTIVMYAISTCQWMATSMFVWAELESTTMSPHMAGFVLVAADYLPVVNFILSDGIVVWRAWLVWGRNLRVLLIPFVLFVGNIATAVVYIIGTALNDRPQSDLCSKYNWRFSGLPLSCVLAAIINLYATSLVGWKAWKHRHDIDIKRHFGHGTKRSCVENVLVLMVESGSVYCVFLITTAVCTWGGAPVGAFFMGTLLTQVSGIYPMIIIVLASLQKTHCDRNFKYESPIAFVPSPVEVSCMDPVTFDLAPAISAPDSDGEHRRSEDIRSEKSLSGDVLIIQVSCP